MLGEQVKRLDKMKTTDTIEQHKHVVFCIEHYNPLGLVRSLGESGIYPDVIILQSSRKLTSRSKYVKHCHYVESIEAGYDYLLKTMDMRRRNLLFIQLMIRLLILWIPSMRT